MKPQHILTALILMIILCSSAYGYHAPLSFYPRFDPIREITIPPEGYPYIQFQVNYGPFKYKKCDYPYDCPPPPPGFAVVVG